MARRLFLFGVIVFTFFINTKSFAQKSDSTAKVEFSGYIDAYWAAYSDSIGINDYQKYTTISPRSNQFGLNIAMITAKYSSDNVRGNFTIHYGDIPKSSWSSSYNFIQEANAGFRICKKLWLDAGFFRSHLGTEALLPKENYTSSISVPTYFEPFYEAGVRLNYNPTEKLAFFLYGLNGYNIYEDNNRKKSAGLLVTYIFGENLNIGYSGYYGDDSADSISVSHFRNMHNVFLNYKSKKFKMTVGGDLCAQQNSEIKNENKTAIMTSVVLILNYLPSNNYRVYGRGEYFNDPDGMMSGVFLDHNNKLTGLKMKGFTLGVEYKPAQNYYIRLEGRELIAGKEQEIFYSKGKVRNYRSEIMINTGISF